MNWPAALISVMRRVGGSGLLVLLLACAGNPAQAQAAEAWQQWMAGDVRAVNVLLSVTPSDLDHLRTAWGANALRLQIIFKDDTLATLTDEGLAALPRFAQRLRAVLDAAAERRMGVVVDLHRAEGGSSHTGRLWKEQAMQDRLVELWRKLASDLKGHPAVIGYDLLNEPTPPDDFKKPYAQIKGTLQDWNVLASRIVAAVRESDSNVPLIVESTDWAKPFRFRQLQKFDDPRVVYSFHMYAPFELTHQGINQFKRAPELRYPGTVSGRAYDRDALRQHMADVTRFAQRHQVPIFVGEFGINHRADAGSRERYIADLLALFGEQKWSWAFHAYKIWDGWMPTDAMRESMRSHAKP